MKLDQRDHFISADSRC